VLRVSVEPNVAAQLDAVARRARRVELNVARRLPRPLLRIAGETAVSADKLLFWEYTGSKAGALFKQGAVYLDGQRITDIGLEIRMGNGGREEAVFKVGRKYAKIVVGA